MSHDYCDDFSEVDDEFGDLVKTVLTVKKSGSIDLYHYEPGIDEFSEEPSGTIEVKKGDEILVLYEPSIFSLFCIPVSTDITDEDDEVTYHYFKSNDIKLFTKVKTSIKVAEGKCFPEVS